MRGVERRGWAMASSLLLLTTFAAARPVDFAKDIRPILSRCVGCHGPQVQMSGLHLDRGDLALRGGYSGPLLRPGDSAGSKLMDMVSGSGKVVMPPAGPKLSAAEVEVRSEEHTSELQSLTNLVCRLLLEK